MVKPNEDYSAYVGMGHNRSTDMQEVAKLAELQHQLEIKVEQAEVQLKAAKEELRDVAEKKLPNLMEELGLADYTTTSGISVEVKEKIRTSITADNKLKAYGWLEENGYGGIIKSNVVTNFKRSDIEAANELVEELRLRGRVVNLERKVEPMTLLAFVTEHLEQGKDIPLDLFSVLRQRIAKVKI